MSAAKNRSLPDYTRGEELFNMISHIVGGGIGVLILIACIIVGAIRRNPLGVVLGILFGVSMIMLYTMSSIYHGLRGERAKRVFQVLDHCTIYFLIAGTYTPILLCRLAPKYPVHAWVTFGVVWGLTALAIVLTAVNMHKYRHFSMICYIGIGWSIIFSIVQVYEVLSTVGFVLLLSGGIAYTVGALIYNLGKKAKNVRYLHSVFHLFVICGSVLQALCIIIYVL